MDVVPNSLAGIIITDNLVKHGLVIKYTLKNPGLLAQDNVLSFASAIWFWMTAQTPKPSCHDVMTGKWKPTEKDLESGRVSGFGTTVNIINGGIECGLESITKTQYRYEYYQYFCKYFGVNPVKTLPAAARNLLEHNQLSFKVLVFHIC